MHIGGVYMYKPAGKEKAYPVYVYAGQFYGSNGGISNHWSFHPIAADGWVNKEISGHDYNNRTDAFVPIEGVSVDMRVRFPPVLKRTRANEANRHTSREPKRKSVKNKHT